MAADERMGNLLLRPGAGTLVLQAIARDAASYDREVNLQGLDVPELGAHVHTVGPHKFCSMGVLAQWALGEEVALPPSIEEIVAGGTPVPGKPGTWLYKGKEYFSAGLRSHG